MKQYLVERPNGNVVVAILRNKSDNTYSYVNLTKGHICPCPFVSKKKWGIIKKKHTKGDKL